MTYPQFKTSYNGKKHDFDGAYGAQCVDLIRFYWKERGQSQPKGVIGAKDFWTAYSSDSNLNSKWERIENSPSGVPKQGDIIIWGPTYGQYGHIAIVDSADVNSFTALSQNDPVGRETHLKKYNYNHVLGWLTPKGTMDYEKLYNEARVQRDNWWQNMSKLIKAAGLDFTEATANQKTDEAVGKITTWKSSSERLAQEVKDKDVVISQQISELFALKQKNAELTKAFDETKKALIACQSNQPETDWIANGKTVATTVGNTVTTINYRRGNE